MAALRRVIVCILALAAPALLSGCGKKGPLMPPEALVPAPITDLAVAQKGERFEVSWPVPSRQQGGGRLTDLSGFILFRRPVLPPAEDCEECPTAYLQMARIEVDYPQGARRIGNRFLYDDTDLGKGKTYQYKVRSFNEDGTQSKDSNKVRRTFVTPPLPPALEAQPSATGVALTLGAPQTTEGSIIGFNIYRAREGEQMPTSPLKQVTGPAYQDDDVLAGTRYSYWATTLAKINGEVVESVPSKVVSEGMSPRD